MNFGMNLRKVREERGLTQTELAYRLGINSRTVSSWEVNRTEPKMGMIERICIVLNCRKTDLIDEQTCEEESDQRSRLMAYAEKIMGLTSEHQATVTSMIDFLTAEEEKNKQK